MRTVATIVSTLVMAFAAIGLAVAAPGRGHDPARAEVTAAGGAVGVSNSREGAAVLSAPAMRPRDSVTGTVRIGNDGDVAGRFALAATALEDTPGPGGGALSGRVVLTVADLSGATQLFSGHPADFDQYDVGTLAPGAQREFRFTLTWPDGGVSDNLYQGSALSVGFAWRAGAVSGAVPTPTPKPVAPKPKAAPTPAPATPVAIADQLGLPAATSCVKGGRLKLKLKAPAGTRIVSATVAVNGKTKARLKGKKVRKPVSLKKLRKTTKLKLSVRLSDGTTHKVTRTYRACR